MDRRLPFMQAMSLEQITGDYGTSGIFALVRANFNRSYRPYCRYNSAQLSYATISFPNFMDKSIRDMDLEVVAKMVFKLCLGIFLLNHVFDITMGIFAMGQKAVEIAEYVILGEASWMNFDIYSVFEDQINDLSVGGMLGRTSWKFLL